MIYSSGINTKSTLSNKLIIYIHSCDGMNLIILFKFSKFFLSFEDGKLDDSLFKNIVLFRTYVTFTNLPLFVCKSYLLL